MRHFKIKVKKNLILLLLSDILLLTMSYTGAYLLRFDFHIPRSEYLNFISTILPILSLKILVFYYFGLYRGMWRYTSIKDLEKIIKASFISSLAIIMVLLIATRFHGFARSIFIIDCILTMFFTCGVRLGIRLFFTYMKKELTPWRVDKNGVKKRKRILIIGAGDAGEKTLREINDNRELVNYEVMGFLDDDPRKTNRFIHGIKVLDNIEGIGQLAKTLGLDEVIIAIPTASGEEMRRIINLCQEARVICKTIPSIGELIDGNISLSTIRDVSYSDLLGRSQVELNMDQIGAYLKGKSILITGAGGSIGSEFCRQVAGFDPEMIIMLDRAESNLYDIEMEIKRHFPQQNTVPVLSSITNPDRLKKIFTQYKPQVVFHAAAYKHVPMMEMYPWEAVYNNILGTQNLLEVALESGGVERLVLISTDKAVRPTNIMGASKRVAEIILQLKYKEAEERRRLQGTSSTTKMMAVRFGNVIGSAGSVIPLFKKQIAHGGPVTVTHPEVTRYFMTINEAVQLVLQAGAMGESGKIYILKMGKPVKIVDMARDLIKLSGFKPDKDIRIEFTGLRPGEKLYEELITQGEGIVPTPHNKLLVLENNESNGVMSYSDLKSKIKKLIMLANNHDYQGIQMKLQEIVPEYNSLTPPAPQHSKEKAQFQIEKIDEIKAELGLVNRNIKIAESS